MIQSLVGNFETMNKNSWAQMGCIESVWFYKECVMYGFYKERMFIGKVEVESIY